MNSLSANGANKNAFAGDFRQPDINAADFTERFRFLQHDFSAVVKADVQGCVRFNLKPSAYFHREHNPAQLIDSSGYE